MVRLQRAISVRQSKGFDALSNHMTIESVTFCVLYAGIFTVAIIVGYKLMTDMLEKIKGQDDDPDE